ncbi:MAG: hypothetical protein ACM3ST_08175 [Bdellovibrio bacteriovorus]
MKTEVEGKTIAMRQRRRLLKVLGGLGILGLVPPVAPRRAPQPREPSLREADFYRPHDLAG